MMNCMMNGMLKTLIFFTHSLTHSFIHSLIHSLTHSFIHSFTHSLTHSFTHSFIHSFTHSYCQSVSQSVLFSQSSCLLYLYKLVTETTTTTSTSTPNAPITITASTLLQRLLRALTTFPLLLLFESRTRMQLLFLLQNVKNEIAEQPSLVLLWNELWLWFVTSKSRLRAQPYYSLIEGRKKSAMRIRIILFPFKIIKLIIIQFIIIKHTIKLIHYYSLSSSSPS